jgi:triosephosphate isomerase
MGSPLRRRIVAGNWKLHGNRAFAHALLDAIAAQPAPFGVDLVVLPPFPLLGELVDRYCTIAFGAQDVSANEQGAYTGEVSASMLVDVGARFGLVGHSERRRYHDESPQGPRRPPCRLDSDPVRRRDLAGA